MTKTCDPKCYELAEHFCDDQFAEEAVRDLAQAIQDAVEDWFSTSCETLPQRSRA